ncbi:MAG: 7TM diverse intracellular signaling domain-containing protein [Burkholderiaceae bacterium]
MQHLCQQANARLSASMIWPCRAAQGLAVLLLWLALAMAWPGTSQAQTLVSADGQTPADFLLDESGEQGFDAIKARFEQGQGRPHASEQRVPLGGVKTVWLRIQLPRAERPLAQVLTVPHPGMDRVNLYHPDGLGGWTAQQSGDLLPVAQWPIRYLYPALAFTQPALAPMVVYLEVRHSHPISVRWNIAERVAFDESSKLWHLMLGSYLGFIALVVVLSVYNGLAWRDPLHFFYAVNVLVLALTQLSLTGLGGEYLWPQSVWWNNMASVVVPTASVTCASAFLWMLMRDHRSAFWPCAVLAVLGGISLVNIGGFLLVGREPFFLLSNLVYPLTFAGFIGCLIWYSRRHPRVGLWMLAGYLCLLTGASFPVLRNLLLLPINVLTQYGVQIGSTLEIPLLLIGLYARSRERRDNQLRLSSMARVDPLTGVASHRVMLERLGALVARQRKDTSHGGVLRLRVSNLEEIRRYHGLEVLQSALLHAAACMTQNIAEGDSVGRHSDGDFVVLLEGRASHPHTVACAQHIQAQGESPTRLLPEGVRLHFLVVATVAPLPERSAEALLARMDATLDEMALRPNRTLRFLEDDPMSDLALI